MTPALAVLAAVAFQAQGAIATDASPAIDLTVVLPAHAANDILIVMALCRSNVETITIDTPAGYTAVTGSPFTRGTTARYWVWWTRAASAAETNPILNTDGSTADLYGIAYTVRGAITTETPVEAVGAATTGTADPAPVTGVTTLTAAALVVAAFAGEDNNNAACTTTGTDPAAYTEHYVETAIGLDMMYCFSEANRTTAGASGTVSVDFDVANPVGWGGIVLSLKPEPAASGPADTFNDGVW